MRVEIQSSDLQMVEGELCSNLKSFGNFSRCSFFLKKREEEEKLKLRKLIFSSKSFYSNLKKLEFLIFFLL